MKSKLMSLKEHDKSFAFIITLYAIVIVLTLVVAPLFSLIFAYFLIRIVRYGIKIRKQLQ